MRMNWPMVWSHDNRQRARLPSRHGQLLSGGGVLFSKTTNVMARTPTFFIFVGCASLLIEVVDGGKN
jgi:hypothetical protein